MTLGEYIRANAKLGIIDFRIRASVDEKGDVEFYMHPQGRDGLTVDFVIVGNHVLPDIRKGPAQSDIDNLMQKVAKAEKPLVP